jgi:hypothetical protein
MSVEQSSSLEEKAAYTEGFDAGFHLMIRTKVLIVFALCSICLFAGLVVGRFVL